MTKLMITDKINNNNMFICSINKISDNTTIAIDYFETKSPVLKTLDFIIDYDSLIDLYIFIGNQIIQKIERGAQND